MDYIIGVVLCPDLSSGDYIGGIVFVRTDEIVTMGQLEKILLDELQSIGELLDFDVLEGELG